MQDLELMYSIHCIHRYRPTALRKENKASQIPPGLSKSLYGACEAIYPVYSIVQCRMSPRDCFGLCWIKLGGSEHSNHARTHTKAIEYTFRANGYVKVWTDLTDVVRQTALAGVCA